MNNRFNFFAPIDTFKKGKSSSGEDVYRVGGLISDASEDADGESLDYNGFDFSNFSFINWNHSKEPKDIIGEPESWNVVPGKGVFMEGVIYPDSEVGQQAVKLMKTLETSKRGNKLGWSIEGTVVERDLVNPNKVKKAKITAVALCPFPKNGNTFADLIKKGFTGEGVYQDKDKLDFEEANGGSQYIIDMIDQDGDRVFIDKEGNINVEKSQTTDNTKALIKEDVEGNEKENLQKAIVTLVKGHKEGLVNDEELQKAIRCKKFL